MKKALIILIILIQYGLLCWSQNSAKWSTGLRFITLPTGNLRVLGERSTSSTGGGVTIYYSHTMRSITENKINKVAFGISPYLQLHLVDRSGIGYGFGLRPQIVTNIQNINLSNDVTEINYNIEMFLEYLIFDKYNIYMNFTFGIASLYTQEQTKFYYSPENIDLSYDTEETFLVVSDDGMSVRIIDNRNYKIKDKTGWHFESSIGTKIDFEKKIKPFIEFGLYYTEYEYSDDLSFIVGGKSGLLSVSFGFDF